MALAFVKTVGSLGQRDTSVGKTSIVIPVSAAPSAGNGIALAVVFNQSVSTDTFTCTDSKGNTYASGGTGSRTGLNVVTFYSTGITALTTSDTITVSWSTADVAQAAVAIEFSGAATSSALDIIATFAGGASSTPSATAVSTANANDLLIGVLAGRWGTTTSVTITEDSNFSNDGTNSTVQSTGSNGANVAFTTTSGGATVHVAYRVVSATGSYGYAPSLSGSQTWLCGVFAIKQAVVSSITVTPPPASGTADAAAPGLDVTLVVPPASATADAALPVIVNQGSPTWQLVGESAPTTAATTIDSGPLTHAVAVGQVVLAFASAGVGSSTNWTGCTDSAGNTYTSVVARAQGSPAMGVVAYVSVLTHPLAVGDSVTVSLSASKSARQIKVLALTGGNTVTPIDVTNAGSNAAGTTSTISLTPTRGYDLALAWFADSAASTDAVALDGAWTQVGSRLYAASRGANLGAQSLPSAAAPISATDTTGGAACGFVGIVVTAALGAASAPLTLTVPPASASADAAPPVLPRVVPPASSTADAATPGLSVTLVVPPAHAGADAPAPAIVNPGHPAPPSATATADAAGPTIRITESIDLGHGAQAVPPADAAASAATPGLRVTLIVPPAGGTADAAPPTLRLAGGIRLIVPAASGTADAAAPKLKVTLPASPAHADAQAPVPILAVLVTYGFVTLTDAAVDAVMLTEMALGAVVLTDLEVV